VLEPNEWDSVLSGARGTIYGGTERISSNRLLDLLGRGWQNEFLERLAGMDLAHCGLAVLLPSGAIGACHTLSRPTSPSLERVTRLGLGTIAKVLTAPFDPSDANLTRS